MLLPAFTIAQTPCENGYAGIYPCENIDLLYHMTPDQIGGGTTNEVWGWVDPISGKEYALLGKSNGVAFIDLSIPTAPVYLGTLPPHTGNSLWRTLRVYNNYLFVGSEASGHGLQVFDLTELPTVIAPPVTFAEDAWYNGFGKCHSLVINEDTGYLYACGTNTYSGGLHIVNIQNPLVPVLAGSYSLSGYTHEAQVLIYNGPDTEHVGKEIVFCYNGNSDRLVLVDATDKSDVTLISQTTYALAGYPHQGWLDETERFLVMDDELDEYQGLVANTRTLIWDMINLDAPLYMGDYIASTTSVDHNQYIIGNLDYQSNYTAGLRILDVTNIASASLTEVAYFDHYPSDDNTAFDGTWMNYPFFESGVIPVTDIDFGMFIVKPNFIHLAENSTDVCAADDAIITIEVASGFAGPINFSVAGLPFGAVANFSANGVTAPTTVVLTISNLPNTSSSHLISIEADGFYNSYTRDFTINTSVYSVWFADNDNDGFGAGAVVNACLQPPLHVANNDDCDDMRNDVFPGATGTQENVDNNCNGAVEGDEIICPDLNNDGTVNISDLLLFMAEFGCLSGCTLDLTGDGTVSTPDLLVFLGAFGGGCL